MTLKKNKKGITYFFDSICYYITVFVLNTTEHILHFIRIVLSKTGFVLSVKALVLRFGPKLNSISMILREGFQKKANYPHFVDKRLTPPPLSTSAEVNNIHTKELFHPLSGIPLHPLLALIHFYQNL